MSGLSFRQFCALFKKNWIVLSKHPFLNILRCFILPVAYGVFLAVAQLFLSKPNNYGFGSPTPIQTLESQFDGSLSLIWADSTNGTGYFSADDIMARVTGGFSAQQLQAVRKVDNASNIPAFCPQNFNLFSECFGAITFNRFPNSTNDTSTAIDYTLRADGGLFHIDVVHHTSDFEKRVLPLQWAVDKAIIELTSGSDAVTPLEWPYTIATNEEQFRDIRLSYIRGLRTLLVLALFICYIGIAYQLPGAFAGERANHLTSHLKAMGLLDSARIASWHLSISLAYLPAWVIVSLIWHFRIFTATHVLIILLVHLLLGLSLASWSFFIAAPFGKSPQLAAVSSTILAIVLAIIALVFSQASTGAAFVYTLIFPPGFYIFAIRVICGFEAHLSPTNFVRPDPDRHLSLLPLIIAVIIDIFLWPYLATLLEHRLYDAREPSTGSSWSCLRRRRARTEQSGHDMSADTAIAIRNLGKTFTPSRLFRKELVTAVSDLTLTIPKYGIYVLLGSNGAGKSTTLSVLGGLTGRTSGTVTFEGGVARPAHGKLGIVPQKNVLFPDLTCFQTLRVWDAIKRPWGRAAEDDVEQLLRDCDLGKKIYANADTLSGGQKRKLQLAIGLIGGSKIVLVDECTSGVDPLSRRALWRTLSSVRHERTIVFTTHFLDEADLLADHIAVLAAPGKLVAEGSPVSLKSSLGQGYSVHVTLNLMDLDEKVDLTGSRGELLERVRTVAPSTTLTSSAPGQVYLHLKTKDSAIVEEVLKLLDAEGTNLKVGSYDVLGSSIEDIFLGLMTDEEHLDGSEKSSDSSSVFASKVGAPLKLSNGRARPPYQQALTIFHKRWLVARRSWLSFLLAVLVAVGGSCIPLFYVAGRPQTCVTTFRNATNVPLYLPTSALAMFSVGNRSSVLESPPNVLRDVLGTKSSLLKTRNIADNASFVDAIGQTYRNLTFGGVSIDLQSGNSLFAWEATPPGINGPAMLNLVSNVLYNHGLISSGKNGSAANLIQANYESFPPVDAGTLVALKWVAFFGAAMSVFPAFFSLYVSRERRSAVQAMQLSNGLSDPIGLWLGHLLFDSIFAILVASIIVIIWAAASTQFHELGLFWIILVQYGIVSALFSYCISLVMSSPLAAFAAAAGYQVVMFLIYLAGYLLTLTYAKTSEAGNIITIIHFTLSLLSPVASLLRASFVSVNLFSLLCDGTNVVNTRSVGVITRFGGPILYLFGLGFALFALLVWADSGTLLPRSVTASRRARKHHRSSQHGTDNKRLDKQDVMKEAEAVLNSDDLLRVLNVSKAYDGKKVVDDVSLGVSRDTVFAMLGPNGAGKTTTFNMIRGDVLPDSGDVVIKGVSVIHHPRSARLSLGVCPQFTAIDSQLTVREHLLIYGRLKGLQHGVELSENVETLLQATGLVIYSDRLASKLSGGNQRKLALSIALIGNPSVILIDEFSTGIDAKMKRDMWGTLRNVAIGKAVVITTHSMEEASALANKVCILAKHMLAVGTNNDLASRYATYEVHFSTRSREEVTRALELMTRVPGARMADDVATRFEVPIGRGLTLAQLFHLLAAQDDFADYTVERATLESVFLKVIRENNVTEEDSERARRQRWKCW